MAPENQPGKEMNRSWFHHGFRFQPLNFGGVKNDATSRGRERQGSIGELCFFDGFCIYLFIYLFTVFILFVFTPRKTM